MSGREREPSAWVEKAEHDLTAVRTLAAAATDVPWDVVVFHCQQAAEKYLKALLVAHDHDVPRIHDLERLLQLCSAFRPSLASLAGDCRRLTQLGFVSRYPDTPGEPSETDAREAMQLANRICEAIRPAMRQAG